MNSCFRPIAEGRVVNSLAGKLTLVTDNNVPITELQLDKTIADIRQPYLSFLIGYTPTLLL
jgi:hypothetical protein